MIWHVVRGVASILGSLLTAFLVCWLAVRIAAMIHRPTGGLPLFLLLALAVTALVLHPGGFAIMTLVFALVGAGAWWIGDQDSPSLEGEGRTRGRELRHG